MLGLPVRELYRSDDQVVELPATGEAYERRLGLASRKNLRNFRNRLQRAHPDFNLRTLEGEEITLALVEQVFDWNKQRIIAKGGRWGFENQPEAPYKAWRWLRSHGRASVATWATSAWPPNCSCSSGATAGRSAEASTPSTATWTWGS